MPNHAIRPTLLLRSLLLLLGVAGCTTAAAQEAPGVDCSQLETLAFLLGSWREETQGTVFEERWERQADGTFKGHAESFKSDGSEHYQEENMVLRSQGGKLVYAADPNQDGKFVEFTLVSCDERSVVFENPEHDFPQRLTYRYDEEGLLHASVTDLKDQGFDLTFRPTSP